MHFLANRFSLPAAHPRSRAKCDFHPRMAYKALTQQVQQLQRAALSQATKRAYKAGFTRYSNFCRKYHITPFPTTELTLCYFAAFLSKEVQHPTVKLYLAAVRSEQLNRGWSDPLKNTHQLSRLLQGLRRGSKARTRLPITPTVLHQIIETVLKDPGLSKHDRYLYAAAISIAYFGCLRAGEVSYPSVRNYSANKHLTLKDIRIIKSTIEVNLKQSKTDQFSRGAQIVIGQSKQPTCPVKLVSKFLQFRRLAQKNNALFRCKDGSLLTRSRLQTILRKALSALNFPAELFGTHSLRIGSATAAAEAGIPCDII